METIRVHWSWRLIREALLGWTRWWFPLESIGVRDWVELLCCADLDGHYHCGADWQWSQLEFIGVGYWVEWVGFYWRFIIEIIASWADHDGAYHCSSFEFVIDKRDYAELIRIILNSTLPPSTQMILFCWTTMELVKLVKLLEFVPIQDLHKGKHWGLIYTSTKHQTILHYFSWFFPILF